MRLVRLCRENVLNDRLRDPEKDSPGTSKSGCKSRLAILSHLVPS
jgi:hypothetical protein